MRAPADNDTGRSNVRERVSADTGRPHVRGLNRTPACAGSEQDARMCGWLNLVTNYDHNIATTTIISTVSKNSSTHLLSYKIGGTYCTALLICSGFVYWSKHNLKIFRWNPINGRLSRLDMSSICFKVKSPNLISQGHQRPEVKISILVNRFSNVISQWFVSTYGWSAKTFGQSKLCILKQYIVHLHIHFFFFLKHISGLHTAFWPRDALLYIVYIHKLCLFHIHPGLSNEGSPLRLIFAWGIQCGAHQYGSG